MKRLTIVLSGIVAGVSSALGCGECGGSAIGSQPAEDTWFEAATDTSRELSELALLDLSSTRAQWESLALKVWLPAAARVECAPISRVVAVGVEHLEARLGDASTVQCTASPLSRIEGGPVSARLVMQGDKIVSSSIVFPVSALNEQVSRLTNALGEPRKERLEDRSDPLPSAMDAYLWVNDRDTTALLGGALTAELVRQIPRYLDELKEVQSNGTPGRPTSLEDLGIGSFKATDTVELSTVSDL